MKFCKLESTYSTSPILDVMIDRLNRDLYEGISIVADGVKHSFDACTIDCGEKLITLENEVGFTCIKISNIVSIELLFKYDVEKAIDNIKCYDDIECYLEDIIIPEEIKNEACSHFIENHFTYYEDDEKNNLLDTLMKCETISSLNSRMANLLWDIAYPVDIVKERIMNGIYDDADELEWVQRVLMRYIDKYPYQDWEVKRWE